jgi:hypothetical protein
LDFNLYRVIHRKEVISQKVITLLEHSCHNTVFDIQKLISTVDEMNLYIKQLDFIILFK